MSEEDRIPVVDIRAGDTAEGHTVTAVRTEGDVIVLTDENGRERRYWKTQLIRGRRATC